MRPRGGGSLILTGPPKTSLHLLSLGFLGIDRPWQIHTQLVLEPAF